MTRAAHYLAGMTVAERIDYLQRLDHLAQAERSANRRDRNIRYGNRQRGPYGYVDRVRRPRKSAQPLGDIVLVFCLAVVGWAFYVALGSQ